MKREYIQKIKDGVLTNDILLECWIGADTYVSKYAYLTKKWQHSYYPEHQIYPEKRNQYIKIRGMLQQVLYQEYSDKELKVKLDEIKDKNISISENVLNMIYDLLHEKKYVLE